ncbi:MAG: cell division protein FtsZ, partial [Petrimonas sp.]
SIAEIITIHGHVNLDFADVETTLKDGGVAIMSRGVGAGKDRVNEAIENAIKSPLLNNNDVFNAKKILINLSFDEENPLMMEEMNALHNFMAKFSHEIEVIWGAAVERGLGEDVKVTLLATGFSIKDVPGIEEQIIIQSQAEEQERRYKEEQRRKEEEEAQRLIDKYYGALGLEILSNTNYKYEPFILTMDELDDDKVLEALEKTPVFKRDRDFNPRAFKVEARISDSLFD